MSEPTQGLLRVRAMVCARCGAAFSCTLGGPCWCSQEDFRLPLPAAPPAEGSTDDCMCPSCLRDHAARLMKKRGADAR
ncbi:MAG: cysteine-rich CWC family protein [Rhizobiales bacterium]|nr:cysteine-rich CWC family protein [Hyphomicrobiales bacterium]